MHVFENIERYVLYGIFIQAQKVGVVTKTILKLFPSCTREERGTLNGGTLNGGTAQWMNEEEESVVVIYMYLSHPVHETRPLPVREWKVT